MQVTLLTFLKLMMIYATDIYVGPGGSDRKGCGTLKNACYSLRFAIMSSSSNDVIFVEGSRAFELQRGPIDIKHNLSIRPLTSDFITLENCGDNFGLFRIFSDNNRMSVSVTLNRFYVRNCSSTTFIYLKDAQMYIINSTFKENGVLIKHKQVTSDQCSQITLSITNSKFYMNYLRHPLDGAISLFGCNFTAVTVSNSEFASSPISVGSLIQDVLFTSVKFTLQPSVTHFFHSHLSRQNNSISFTNCSFASNTKIQMVPILVLFPASSVQQSIIRFTNTNFTSSSELRGGALHISPTISNKVAANLKVSFRNCAFRDCSSENNGGAIYIKSIKTLILNQCSFTNNSALNGGALSLDRVDEVRITGSIFNWNSAKLTYTYASRGGAIHSLSSGLSVVNSSFSNNAAEFEGDSLFAFMSVYISLANSAFKSCHDGDSSPRDSVVALRSCSLQCSNINMSNVVISIIEPTGQIADMSLISAEGKVKLNNVTPSCPSTHKLRQSSVKSEGHSPYDHRIVDFWCQPINKQTIVPLY